MNIHRHLAALVVWATCTLLVPSTAWAASWGEIIFQTSVDDTATRLVGFYDGSVPQLDAFRYVVKQGASAWDESASEGSGWTMDAHRELVAAAKTSQDAYDLEATALLADWYEAKSSTVKGMLWDATRRASGVGFVIRLEGAGYSCAATIADYDAMAAAAEVGDRASFDAAATNAWGSWYLELTPEDADVVYQIVIHHVGAG